MSSTFPASPISASEGYRLWAKTYDDEPNPLLSLEQRVLEWFLPPLAGLDVVDLGCGTGRWLNVLRNTGARSLLGIDPSEEMLSLAREKLGETVRLVSADYGDAAIADASADVVLCNFVLSYIDEPGHFLKVVSKILRPGGLLFLTDMHPETAAELNWRRGAGAGKEFKEIRTHQWTLAKVIAICRKEHLKLELKAEPVFGDEERKIFEKNGKREYFETIRERPAIYLLRLRAPEEINGTEGHENRRNAIDRLKAARFAVGAAQSIRGALSIDGSRIAVISGTGGADSHAASEEACVDLSGYLVLPGLINAHDHLEFGLFPRLGRGAYKNFLEWAQDIHESHAAEIARHRQVPKSVRLWWGGIRNLLCGVTTVCHHNPFEPNVFTDEFVVRVLRDFGWAHSLPLEPGAGFKKSETPEHQPFFIHLAEGIDEQSREEVFELERAGALNADTVIIHGLGMDARGRALLRSAGAGLIWCPSSNLFLFGRSLDLEEIRRFPKVALGSDSALTADGDLLDEIRCAHEMLETPAAELYEYVTQEAARLLGSKNGEGSLRAGGFADLIAVRDAGVSPAETLSTLSYRDVELVLLGGRVQLASEEIRQRLPIAACEGLLPMTIEGTVRWIRAPLDRLFEETAAHLGGDIYLGGKQVCLGT